MSNKTGTNPGSVVSLWRYPVKSMMGEELNAADVTQRGLLGDHAYALVDGSDGKVASAKNPRKWPNLFDFRTTFIEPPRISAKMTPVRITLPDGTIISSERNDLNQILSKALSRDVTLDTIERGHEEAVESSLPKPLTANAEEYWPDMEELDYRDAVTDFALPEGTFFDCAVVHLLTMATLDRLCELYPQGRFEVRRFRPNIVVEPSSGEKNFIENDWIGHMLDIGDEVCLSVSGPCALCVMTTLLQGGDLPRDLGILRTAAKQNKAIVGVYAAVGQGGTVRRGDPVRIE